METKYFMGIDGGGTKTTAVVTDQQGNCLAHAEGASINYYSVGMDTARKHLHSIMDQIHVQYNLNQFDSVCIGMSAINHEADQAITNSFTDGIIDACNIYMHSDSYIALMGLTLGEPGILIISGTGSIGIALSMEKKLVTVGGWGYILGDQGSAYDIGLKGIRAAVSAYEGWRPYTSLIDRMKRYFNVQYLPALIDRLYNPPVERHVIAGFAREVAAAAEQGDSVSIEILRQAIDDLILQLEVLFREVGSEHMRIGVHGGVFQNNSLVFQQFVRRLNEKHPDKKVVTPVYPPEVGAIFVCFINLQIPITNDVLQQLKKLQR